MKSATALTAVVAMSLLICNRAVAKEAPADLKDYVKRSRVICVCKVTKANPDGTVTVDVVSSLKGKKTGAVVIRGKTGFCVVHGPVSRFMKPGQTYLVFLFTDNTVGRLGGILDVEKGRTVVIRYIHGFADADYDKGRQRQTLSLEKAAAQIKHLLHD